MSAVNNGEGFFGSASITGLVEYQGTWNATTNTPTLASGVGTQGYYYTVSVAGSTNLDGITDWQIGDMAIFNGTAWEKIDNTDQVTSVFSRTGDVTAQSGDYTAAEVTNAFDKTADDMDDIADGTTYVKTTNDFTDAEKTNLGNQSGTNTGDQTTIAGITGTQAEFDTACTDGNFVYTDDIGSSVQAYDANTAKYDAATANFTGTLQNGGSNVIVDTDIGSTVQAYDANNATASSTTTFTNKTFDANGTGNSISNIDVADLANGTDGELITWDAAGAPATVAAGTAAQVLTSNGAGAAPTFQDAAGGGVSLYEATVGATGADYTTLGAAIADGKTRVLVIDDTTETGNITLPSNTVVHGIGRDAVNINMGTYNFPATTNTGFIFKNLKITFAYSSSKSLFSITTNSTGNFVFDNMYFVNNSTNDSTNIFSNLKNNCKTIANNIILDLPNYFNVGWKDRHCTLSNFYIIGGGTNCGNVIVISFGNINGVSFSGTLSTTTATLDGSYSTFSDLTVEAPTDIGKFSTDRNVFSNINIYNSELYVDGDYNTFIGGYVDGIVVPSGSDNNIFDGIQSVEPAAITGNDTTLTGCRIGADAGGGSNTITVNAGANRTIINGCRTDAAISDSGTDTVGVANVVY